MRKIRYPTRERIHVMGHKRKRSRPLRKPVSHAETPVSHCCVQGQGRPTFAGASAAMASTSYVQRPAFQSDVRAKRQGELRRGRARKRQTIQMRDQGTPRSAHLADESTKMRDLPKREAWPAKIKRPLQLNCSANPDREDCAGSCSVRIPQPRTDQTRLSRALLHLLIVD